MPTNTAGKAEQQGIGSNQYSGKLVPTNRAGNILHQKIPHNTAEGGKLVPTNTAGKQKLVPTNTAGKQNIGNWIQPIRQEIGSDECSGKYFA